MKPYLIPFFALLLLTACVSNGEPALHITAEKIADGFQFIEGPVWVPGTGLLFSDIPASKIYLYQPESGDTEVFVQDSLHSNGLALDLQGQLLAAQHGARQIAMLTGEGKFTPLAGSYNGISLNSPNDLLVASDGSIYFTDPPFGLMDAGLTSDLGFSGVYCLDSQGSLILLDDQLDLPNGIALSPDESKLYVDDSKKCIIYIWDLSPDHQVSNKQVFAKIPQQGYADGMTVDAEGKLYVTGPGGVWVFSDQGDVLEHIALPGQNSASNCAWGDEPGKTLYVTSNNALYRIEF